MSRAQEWRVVMLSSASLPSRVSQQRSPSVSGRGEGSLFRNVFWMLAGSIVAPGDCLVSGDSRAHWKRGLWGYDNSTPLPQLWGYGTCYLHRTRDSLRVVLRDMGVCTQALSSVIVYSMRQSLGKPTLASLAGCRSPGVLLSFSPPALGL